MCCSLCVFLVLSVFTAVKCVASFGLELCAPKCTGKYFMHDAESECTWPSEFTMLHAMRFECRVRDLPVTLYLQC